MRSETTDDETQASTSSQTEGKKDQHAARTEREGSEFNTIFWDIDVVKDLPIWAEPITMSTERIFGVFDPTADEDVLVSMGAIDGVLPDRTKYECDRLRSAIELVYNTPKDCRWVNLGEAIRRFTNYEVSKDDLVRYSGHGVFHGVERNRLLQVAQVVVSVDQVLQVLADFFHKRERERFILDAQFAFLRLLAHHPSRTEILATY